MKIIADKFVHSLLYIRKFNSNHDIKNNFSMNFVYKKFYLKLKKYYAVFADVTVWTLDLSVVPWHLILPVTLWHFIAFPFCPKVSCYFFG